MIDSPRLAALAGSRPAPSPSNSLLQGSGAAAEESCELCGTPIPPAHRHVADVHARSLLCACRGCAVLLGREGAGGGRYRLVPERRLALESFRLDDEQWVALGLPVDLAFFLPSTTAGRVVALYPSPAGATESLLELEAWSEVERANPVLAELEPDVEALLVNRAGGAREHYLVPIDDCYALVALVKTHWHGLSGGDDVARELHAFFERLRAQASREAAGVSVQPEVDT